MSEIASYDLDLDGLDRNKSSRSYRRSKFVASCFCTRRFGFYLINAYLFNFLITAISLTNFAIEIRRPQNRLSGTFTLILTSISFKWVTNRSLPTVSYMTSLDRYQIVNILYMCLLCVWHAIVAAFFETPADKDYYDKWFLLGFSILFVLFHIYFLIGFMIAYKKIKAIRDSEKEFKCKLRE